MEYRPLGATGLQVSRLGLGTMVLGDWGNRDLDACHRIINTAIDAGVNLVDTADMYADGQNEEIVGRAIAGRRDDVVLCTKFHHPIEGVAGSGGNSRRWIDQAVDDSLRRLGVDHIDLYQAHRPDPAVPMAETVEALSDLVAAGKIRHWGTSTFPAHDLVELHHVAAEVGGVAPATEQPPYSALCRHVEADVLPVCRERSVGVLTWSPLSGGWLTGKHQRGADVDPGSRAATNPDHFDGDNAAKHDAVAALIAIAEAAGLTVTQLALAWNVEHPAVTAALIGPRTEAQLDDLLTASEVTLDADTLDAIDAVVAPGATINPADAGWEPPGLQVDQRRRPRA